MSKRLNFINGFITGFIALSAIGGGIAMLAGLENNRFPPAWLRGSPFKDYTTPALVLAIVVGGSSLAACLAIFSKDKLSQYFSLVAGLMMVGFIVFEVMTLKQVPPGPTFFECLYFGLGLALIVFSLGILLNHYRNHRVK